jgi:hypothetical protein
LNPNSILLSGCLLTNETSSIVFGNGYILRIQDIK